MVRQALEQSWPPFVLVVGLLAVGLAAHAEGLFARLGGLLERLPGGTGALYAACLALVAVVTAVLNLDTAVVFLTPVLVVAARRRGVAEESFLYAAVFMANASSLFLPGSNLTNLIVFRHESVAGGAFAGELLVPALAACLVTAAGLTVLFRHALFGGPRGNGHTEVAEGGRPGSGWVAGVAVAVVAAFTVAFPEPALPVAGVGFAAVAVTVVRGRLTAGEVLRRLGLPTLAGLFAAAVALGSLARAWDGPSRLVAGGGSVRTAAVGAAASALVNNLPAAVLLSSGHLAHPRALLVGLNVGPNLAVTGSLSAVLWMRAARDVGAEASPAAFSRRGVVLMPLALAAALVGLGVGGP